jgi:hypothetical protein
MSEFDPLRKPPANGSGKDPDKNRKPVDLLNDALEQAAEDAKSKWGAGRQLAIVEITAEINPGSYNEIKVKLTPIQ